MASVQDHYDQLLARHYTWMFGLPLDAKVEEQRSLLAPLLPAPSPADPNPLAIDLGSGSGFQTIALARLGFHPVVAIDLSADLLAELRTHAAGLPVETHQSDLLSVASLIPANSAATVVCMGDTLTHLSSKPQVSELFRAVAQVLRSGGVFVITYRDLTADLHGLDRFFPVRSDETTVMTCFVEYTGLEHVTVHDLIYTRESSGWTLNKSSYTKLRLAAGWLVQELRAAGLEVLAEGPAGRLTQIIARKP